MRYFLIGFMGAGKSLIGKSLAEKLNLQYIDLDNFIEESEKKTIIDIFHNSGESYFRELEKKYINQIIKQDNLLVSTGGGTPTFHALMDTMNSFGETIYLECSKETLFKRLNKDKSKRPMISSLSSENLKKYIEIKMEERKCFYKKATYIISNDNSRNPVNKIINVLR
tara:strand:+ start:193 stop:696 length:504 start_codon:yes stop_codon:yes gene_type:complete